MAIPRFWLWWRRAAKHRAITASGSAILVLAVVLTVRSRLQEGGVNGVGPHNLGSSEPALVELTLLRNAREKGALCLDGSPPAYHLQRGFGSGSNSWLLHLEGGGWCNTVASCSSRKETRFGSSHYMDHEFFNGILSHYPSQNPDFYNWNKVKVRYCDGASFSGDLENEVQNGTKLFFRGQRIWKAIMAELLSKGLADAKQAFLTGCSAGGLATFVHCDNFRASLPKVATVKCLADAGFFLDYKDISGKSTMQSFYNDVINLQDVGKNLQKGCISRMEPTQCFFPREIIKNIKTPVFILNPAYDFWQVQNILAPEESDPQQQWLKCKLNIHNCDSNQMKILQEFRESMLNALGEFQNNQNGGMFIVSCFIHCQTMHNDTWHSPNSPRINNQTIAEAVGNWYFDRREVKEVDCAYPCNPTCYNIDLS